MLANSLLTSKVREQTVDISVSDRAATIADSAVEEVAYSLLKDLNDPASKLDLYRKLREFDPSREARPPEDDLFEEGLSTIVQPEQTTRAYQDATDARAGEVKAGPYERLPLGPATDSNESFGTFGFRQTTLVKPPGNYRSVEEKVFFLKAFKVLLLAPPCPFNKHTLFLKDSQRFRTYYELYQQAAAEVDRHNATAAPGDQLTMPPFPLADPGSNRPIVSTTETVSPGDLTLISLAPGAAGGARRLVESLTALFERIAAGYKRLPAEEVAELDSRKAYEQLAPEALERHATHIFDNFAELVGLISRNGVLTLNGFYLVRREVTLSQPWTGRGVIATLASEGITIRSAPRQGEGRLTLIAGAGPVDLSGLPTGDAVYADILAPAGVLQGYTGKHIHGVVMVRDLDSVPDPFAAGPTIHRPPDTDYVPWAGAGEMPPAFAKQFRFFLNPGFVSRQYLSQRKANP